MTPQYAYDHHLYTAITAPLHSRRPPLRRKMGALNRTELDRLLRYEASLDRSFDRTLSQLERLQRMRLGQPVPVLPKVEVHHSVS
jgi:hypothetical protein